MKPSSKLVIRKLSASNFPSLSLYDERHTACYSDDMVVRNVSQSAEKNWINEQEVNHP